MSNFGYPLFDAFYGSADDLDYLPPDPYTAPGNLVFDPSNPWETDWHPLDPSFPPPVNWLEVAKIAISGKQDAANTQPASNANQDSPSKVFAAAAEHGQRDASHHFRGHAKNRGHHGHRASSLPSEVRSPSPAELFEPFKKKTILIIGDSVDRGNLKYLAENLGLGFKIAQWENAHDTEYEKYLGNGADPAYLPHQVTLPDPVDALITNCFLFGLVSPLVIGPVLDAD